MIIVAHFEEVGCAETTGRGVQNKGDWRGACLDPNFRLLSGWGAFGLLLLCSWCFLSLAFGAGWGQWGSSVELRAVRRHFKRTVAAARVPFVPRPEYHPPLLCLWPQCACGYPKEKAAAQTKPQHRQPKGTASASRPKAEGTRRQSAQTKKVQTVNNFHLRILLLDYVQLFTF